MRKLLIFTSLAEGGFGVLLIAAPAIVFRLLFATVIIDSAIPVGRVAGACLIALGIGCWPRGDSRRQFYIMLAWSVLAACFLVVAGLRWPAGVLLWPAVVIHAAIALLLWTSRLREGAV